MLGEKEKKERALIVSLLYKPDAQARESPKAASHPSLARRASMSSLLAFRKVTIKAAKCHVETAFPSSPAVSRRFAA